MFKKRWWCDWYLSPSEGEYFREDEIYFFRLIILIPFILMLLSWSWLNHLTLFPYWFNTLSTSILTIVCLSLSMYRDRFFSPIHWIVLILLFYEMWWHIVMFVIETVSDRTDVCEKGKTLEYPWGFLCKWLDTLSWCLVRDGAYFVVVLCAIVSLQCSHPPCLSISDELLDEDQLFDLLVRSNHPRRRRSPFVIHYVLLRRGHIHRRCRRRLVGNK